MRGSSAVGQSILYTLLVLLSVVFLIPFAWTVSTSLKTRGNMWLIPPEWIPKSPQWSNYADAFTYAPFGRYALNTLMLEVLIIFGTVLSCTLVAYGFARFRFRWREPLFILMLSTMLIPGEITFIPRYLMFSYAGWIDTYYPLVVPAFFGNAFYIFLLRQYLMTIPHDMDEAAKVDGANSLQIYWRIFLPMLRPGITIVTVFTFTAVYNDFMGPLLFLNDQAKFTIAVGLATFVSSVGSEWNLLMAASTVTIVPLLIIYYFAQRQMIGGIASFGIKG